MSDATNWDFAQGFLSAFKTERSDLASRLDAAKSTVPVPGDILQDLTADTVKLTKSLVDATGSLPSYDQRQREVQLKELEQTLDELRAASAPKSKFAFKRKASKPPSAATPSAPKLESSVDGAPKPPLPEPAAGTLSTNLTLSSHSNKYLDRGFLPPSSHLSSQSDLTISELVGCVVDLLPSTDAGDTAQLDISALHIQKLADTVLLLPTIKGSVLLHDLTRCVIVVGCHQFRMHASTAVDVYLHIPSNPVIEHCSRIRFAAYPASFFPNTLGAEERQRSNHLAVQDFSHIRATPSPNWAAMQDDRANIWSQIRSDACSDVAKGLDALLPAPAQ
ncbi:hypothetical protein PLICRDRAFT_38679 [Plicaturopsis crispa FD-325 SS-3]|nr:hypothetical protein PLICRDRAFT_38679 [Plicaturopsis crispa FD-325 SS-3]